MLKRTGTSKCKFCALEEEEHSRLLEGWARGELTLEEVGETVGLSGHSWSKHLQRHVPGWKVAVAEARASSDSEAGRLRARILEEMKEAPDGTSREHLLEVNVLSLRMMLSSMVERGPDPRQARSVRDLTAELERQSHTLEAVRRERAAREAAEAAAAREAEEGDGWAALEAFQEDLNGIMDEDPGLAARVLDAMYARQARRREEGRPPEKEWRMVAQRPEPPAEEEPEVGEEDLGGEFVVDEEGEGDLEDEDEGEDQVVEWGGEPTASPSYDR